MPDETHTPCPACRGRLYPKLLRCADCGIEVTTRYATNEFSDLEAEDLHLLRIFVLCEGRIRDMESALGVSYPTVKSRLAALRTRLGLASDAVKNKQADARTEPASARDILDRLSDGGLTYEEALERIRALRGKT
ncbi:MAG TPA: DUF2089 family protein [Pseudomonadales bacterium]|nr:DUF2089 family protein [Pseudomonadales bacterium]